MMEEPSYSDNAGSLGPSQHYKNKCKDRGTRLPLVSVPGVDWMEIEVHDFSVTPLESVH